jgi:hypothetical protein
VELPVGDVAEVVTVRVAEPDPPEIEVVLRVLVIVEGTLAVRVTVPVNPLVAVTLTLNVPEAPAITLRVVGLTDKVKSELPPPEVEVESRRGEMQPAINNSSNAATTRNV